MKKTLYLLCLLAGAPMVSSAAVGLEIHTPGISIHLGDRDGRGYYWDGYNWRAPRWWNDHQGRHHGERGPRGDYWNGHGWQRHPPARRSPPPRPAIHHAPPRHQQPAHRPQPPHHAPAHHEGRPNGGDHGKPKPPKQNQHH